MNLDAFIGTIKKHGALGAVVLWLLVTHGRLNKVEELLFNCYRARYATVQQAKPKRLQLLAVIPEKPTVKREKEC